MKTVLVCLKHSLNVWDNGILHCQCFYIGFLKKNIKYIPLVDFDMSIQYIWAQREYQWNNNCAGVFHTYLFVLTQWGKCCIRSCFQAAALSYTVCGGDPFWIGPQQTHQVVYWSNLTGLRRLISILYQGTHFLWTDTTRKANCHISDLCLNRLSLMLRWLYTGCWVDIGYQKYNLTVWTSLLKNHQATCLPKSVIALVVLQYFPSVSLCALRSPPPLRVVS